MKTRHFAIATALGAVMLLGLAACAPGGGSAGNTAGSVSRDISGKHITLRVLDAGGGDAGTAGAWFKWVANNFEKKHPNVTIQRTSQSFNQETSTVNLRLSDPNGPDIAAINNGWQSMGTLVKGGRLLDLDPYADLYGWKSSFPKSAQQQLEFSTDGKQMGTGSLFAAPNPLGSFIGLYYNKSMLDSLGLPVPSTLADLEKDAAAVKAAGKTAIAYSAQDGSTPMYFGVQNLYGASTKISDFVYSKGDVPVTSTGAVQAAETVKKWSDAGWLTPNFAGVQSVDVGNDFVNGDAAFYFYYTGSLSFSSATKHNFGYVQLPQVTNPGVYAAAAAATAYQFGISAKSKNPNAAAAFINFLNSKESEQKAVDLGNLPFLHQGLKIPTNDPEFATEIAAQQKLVKNDGYLPYFDWSTPTMLQTASSALQELYAGKISPSQLADALQADHDKFDAQNKQG